MAIDPGILSQPHNNLMLAILASPSRAASLLRASLEPWIVERLADEPPVARPGTFVDENLRASRSDRLFEVRFKSGRPGFVYVLLEHKSTSDPATALQVARYKVRIWEDYAQGRAGGSGRCRRSSRWCCTTGGSLGRPRARWPTCWRTRTSGCGRWSLRSATTCGTWAASTSRSWWRIRGRGRAWWRCATRTLERLAALEMVLEGLPEGTEYARQLVLYILNVWRVPVPELKAAAGRAKPGRGEQIVGPIVQELIDQGKVEGMAQGMAKYLLSLLEHRFGPVPGTVRRQIEGASPAQLDVWHAAALSGQSLSEVLGSRASD